MKVISTTSTSGMASGKIHTDLTRKTILARTGIDGTEPASVVPSGPAPASGAWSAPAVRALPRASVSDSVGTAGSWLLCVDGVRDDDEAPLQPADAALAVTLACFWLYMRARSSAPKGTTSRSTN